MSMISYTEQQGNITGDNVQEPTSGSFSVITTNLYWKSVPKDKYSYFIEGFFPLLPGSGNSFFGGSFGVEYYFSNDNGILRETNGEFKISMDPKLRYYAIANVSSYYFAYETETAKKNDINVSLNAGAGAVYSMSNTYGLKADVVVGRGVGVITSTLLVRAFFSYVYYWDN